MASPAEQAIADGRVRLYPRRVTARLTGEAQRRTIIWYEGAEPPTREKQLADVEDALRSGAIA